LLRHRPAEEVGEKPELCSIENRPRSPGTSLQMPMPARSRGLQSESLWPQRSRAFFKATRHAGRRHSDRAGEDRDNATTQRKPSCSAIQGRLRHHDFAGSKLLAGKAAQVLPGRLLTADGRRRRQTKLGQSSGSAAH